MIKIVQQRKYQVQMIFKDKFHLIFKGSSLPNFQTIEKYIKLSSYNNTDTKPRQRCYMKIKV